MKIDFSLEIFMLGVPLTFQYYPTDIKQKRLECLKYIIGQKRKCSFIGSPMKKVGCTALFQRMTVGRSLGTVSRWLTLQIIDRYQVLTLVV